jgi:hypothetical protein
LPFFFYFATFIASRKSEPQSRNKRIKGHRRQHGDGHLGQTTSMCVVRRLQALEEYKSHIEIKRIQTTTMRDRSSER